MTEYEQMRAELELLHTLSEAEEDVRTGRIAHIDDSFNRIRESLLTKENRLTFKLDLIKEMRQIVWSRSWFKSGQISIFLSY